MSGQEQQSPEGQPTGPDSVPPAAPGYPQNYPPNYPPPGYQQQPPPPNYPPGYPQQPYGAPFGYQPGYGYPGMQPIQQPQQPPPLESDLLYPAAPITLKNAVIAEQAGLRTGKPLRKFNWWFGDVLIMFVLWFIAAVAAVMIVGSDSGADGSVLVLQILPWLGLAGWPILLTIMAGNGPRIDLGIRWSWRDIGWGVLYGIASLIVASIIGFITTMVAGEFDSSAGEVGESLKSSLPILIIFSLCIAIGAPFVEEIAFRGLVFTSLAKFNMWPILTVIISAAVFAGFHFEPIRFFLLFGVGLVLGFARWHTGSITTTIVAHMCNNLPGALFLLLS